MSKMPVCNRVQEICVLIPRTALIGMETPTSGNVGRKWGPGYPHAVTYPGLTSGAISCRRCAARMQCLHRPGTGAKALIFCRTALYAALEGPFFHASWIVLRGPSPSIDAELFSDVRWHRFKSIFVVSQIRIYRKKNPHPAKSAGSGAPGLCAGESMVPGDAG